jgi:uncharacterized protein involved in exopolysaccharide biosynthesis
MAGAFLLAPAFAAGGFFSGVQLYESQAILRVYPQETNILYATGEASVLKIFDSFVKAETTYVASHQVMERAAAQIEAQRPDLAGDMNAKDLAGSIEIRRSDSLIVLKTRSKDAALASQKLDAVVTSYLALKAEAEEARTSVRLGELRARDAQLTARLSKLRSDQLEIGGEFGLNALAKAHVEKIAQIDALAARKSEVAATLATLEASSAPASADTSNQEIMRATLLDRAMADLSFERAKLMSELAGLRAGYEKHTNLRFEQKEYAKLEEIAVIEEAMANRREQIRVLGQTGALTDATQSGDDTTTAEIQALYEKVANQLAIAREEAIDLNRRRIELDHIENEIGEAEALLEETRRALEVIRLESGRALPGYAVVMSPPSTPVDPADDSRKMLMAGGCMGGIFLAAALALALAFSERRVRFAETLLPFEDRVPVRQVSAADDGDPHAADLLRNELQLQSLRRPRLVGKPPVIAITRAASGDTTEFAQALAQSFARSRMKTLFVEADLEGRTADTVEMGWSNLLSGSSVKPRNSGGANDCFEIGVGSDRTLNDHMVSATMVRAAFERISEGFDVLVVSAGSLHDRLSAQFILSNSEVAVLAVKPADARVSVASQIDRLDSLPRNGSVAVMRSALAGDPWLAVRT